MSEITIDQLRNAEPGASADDLTHYVESLDEARAVCLA